MCCALVALFYFSYILILHDYFYILFLIKHAVRPKSCYFMVLNTFTEPIRKNRIEGIRIETEPNRENPEPFQLVVFRLSPTSPNLSLKPNRFRLIGSKFEID